MNPKFTRYNTRRPIPRAVIEALTQPCPMWLLLVATAIAFGACIQLIGARHELRRTQEMAVAQQLWEAQASGKPLAYSGATIHCSTSTSAFNSICR